MGTFIYGVAPAVTVEDRTLRHIQAVMVAKLRRGESFAFSWDEEPGVEGEESEKDGGQGAVWVSSSASLYFRYDEPQRGRLNQAWLEALMQAANTNNGLRAVPEPPDRVATGAV